MPRDPRKINDSIRLSKGRGLFTTEMVDELEAVLTAEEAAELTDKGLIEGFEIKEVETDEFEIKEVETDEFEIPTEAQLSKMSKADLVVVAGKVGVEVTPDSMTNKQITEAILAKQ